ncbi:MAG TPA: complex I NDUFA9 subunit family protein [Gammaproteobacteria bacterium]
MKQHTISIIGGSGFVGHHLAARLVQDGHRVRVLSRRRERHRELLVLPTLELTECNVHDEKALSQALTGSDVVINLVGILNERGHNGKGFHRAHVELSETVVRACRSCGIERLLHMSALGADAQHGSSYYQRSKGEAEDLVHAAKGLRVTSFRPSVIFGPDDAFFNRFAGLLKRTPLLFPLACAEAHFAPVYVGDVVECYARAIDNPATIGQRYELCGPHQYSLYQLVQYTARQLGLKRWLIALPDWASRLQARVLEFAPGKPFSRDNYDSMQQDNLCDGEFPAVFGIIPRSIESTVPGYLNPVHQRSRYPRYRASARRN